MTLTELRYIVALAHYRHFGKAANQCCVSQPTLSVAICKLEKELEVCIFERQHKQIHITDIGEKIIIQAQKILEETKQIETIVNSSKSHLDSPLRMGGIYTVAPYLFPKFIPKLHKLAPEMPLMIEEDYTANLKIKLQQGALDVAFIALPFDEPGIVTKPLYIEPFVVLMQKEHKLASKKAIDAEDLTEEKVMLLGEGHCFRDQVIDACPHCYTDESSHLSFENSSLETLRHMVASGFGITIFPSSATWTRHYQTTLCIKSFSKKIPKRTIALAWRASFPRTKAIDMIIQALNKCKLNDICLLPT